MMNRHTPDRSHSITWYINRLKEHDEKAADEIWRLYFERLLPVVRNKLRSKRDKSLDEEDILVSVFDRFFRAAKEDRFAKLEGSTDLWQILLMLTERRIVDAYRHSSAQKRGSGDVVSEVDLPDVDLSTLRELVNREPSAEFVATFKDSVETAVYRLRDGKTREVALLQLEGFSNEEIAQRLEISVSTVERKVRVVQAVWEREFDGNQESKS